MDREDKSGPRHLGNPSTNGKSGYGKPANDAASGLEYGTYARTARRRPAIFIIVSVILAAILLAGGALAFLPVPSHTSRTYRASRSANRSGGRARSKGGSARNDKSSQSSSRDDRNTTFTGQYGIESNWVIQQNKLPGTTAWNITGNQIPNGIMGYANHVQARLGQTVTLYVSTQASSFHVDAFRMGYYQGKGGRLVWKSHVVQGAVQPSCPLTPGINMVQCNWPPSLSFQITQSWPQGQYLLKLVGSGGQQSYVPLTIWDPDSHAAYVIMSGVITQQVFNPFGGYDLYQGATPCAPSHYPCSSRSRVVSFDRPYAYGNGAASYLSLVYPLTRFAEQRGLDVTYWTDLTLAEHGNLLANHKVLISPGHDEEWSLHMRQATVAAAAKGVNLIFFGASPILRKVRLQPSPLGTDMQVVNYRNPSKDPLYNPAVDASCVSNSRVTQNWWGQAPACQPASSLVGARYIGYNNYTSFPLVVSDASSWFFAGTGLVNGAKVPGVLSTDFQAYDPSRTGNPPGLQILAHSPVSVEFHPNRKYADTTYYTMPTSHAGVFQSGTNAWITSLTGCPPSTPHCPRYYIRIMTGNLLKLFGQGPAGLTQPSQSNWRQFYG
ncbi:MAG: hypothetical protein M1420_03720 [Actinobacteria bacterium]|nr:hypothetical protein [Actinomycetota bacterium]